MGNGLVNLKVKKFKKNNRKLKFEEQKKPLAKNALEFNTSKAFSF
jgi:hypothetical protein